MKDRPERRGSTCPVQARWLLLVLLAAGFFLAVKEQAPAPVPGPRDLPKGEGNVAPRDNGQPPGMPEPAFRPAPVDPVAESAASALTRPAIATGHEGHGDECAQCLAERKLAACREDYALLCYSQLAETHELDGAPDAKLLEACRRLAASVLTEWSFPE